MRTSSLRLLVASIWSSCAASSLNFTLSSVIARWATTVPFRHAGSARLASNVRIAQKRRVAPAGFEPAISASPGARRAPKKPHSRLRNEEVAPAGFEPAISASPGARRAPKKPHSRLRNEEVAPAGFEPAISALRGLRPGPLDDGATPAGGRRWD